MPRRYILEVPFDPIDISSVGITVPWHHVLAEVSPPVTAAFLKPSYYKSSKPSSSMAEVLTILSAIAVSGELVSAVIKLIRVLDNAAKARFPDRGEDGTSC